MRNTLIKSYLQEVYFFNNKDLEFYPEPRKDYFRNSQTAGLQRDPRVRLKPIARLFLTKKPGTLEIKKISSAQLCITLTGLLGKLTFVRKFNFSEVINYDPAMAEETYFPVYFEQNHLMFNMLRARPSSACAFVMSDYLFLTVRAELASFYGEISNRYDWLIGGFFHEFIIRGIGYRYRFHRSNAQKSLFFKIGYGHRVLFSLSAMKNITFRNNRRYDFVLSSMNKGALKQFAEQVRLIKPSDAYKGKGIKYYHAPLKLKIGKVR
jgi:hypothetical protein